MDPQDGCWHQAISAEQCSRDEQSDDQQHCDNNGGQFDQLLDRHLPVGVVNSRGDDDNSCHGNKFVGRKDRLSRTFRDGLSLAR